MIELRQKRMCSSIQVNLTNEGDSDGAQDGSVDGIEDGLLLGTSDGDL